MFLFEIIRTEKTFECKEEEYTVCFLPSTRVDWSQLLGVQLKIQTQEKHSIYNQSIVYTANESIPSCKLKYNPTAAKSSATQRQLKPTFSFRLVSGGHTIKVQVLAQLINAGAGRYVFVRLTLVLCRPVFNPGSITEFILISVERKDNNNNS